MDQQEDLDWVRTVSAVGIVLLHTASVFVSPDSRLTVLGVSPALLFNQITRFAVPVFFMLSGLGLGLSKRPLKLPGFWLHRLRKTAIPYVLWSLFYFLVNNRRQLPAMGLLPALRTFGKLLLTGGAASHLWFLPVLLQLYFLYPGLRWLMKRFPRWTLLLSFLVTLLSTLTICVPLPFHGWVAARLWRLFPTWLFYFVLGMAVTGDKLEKLRGFAGKHALPLCILTAVLALVYAWDARRSGNLDSIKLQLFLYAPLCFLALLASWKWCGQSRALTRFSAYAARHSMTVYFAHIYFLTVLRRFPLMNRNILTMLLTFAAVLALSLILGLLPELYARYRRKKKTA